MKQVWVIAAGTGGHIFPGLSLAEKLKEQHPDWDFLFFGTRDRLEAKIIPERGQKLRFVSSGQWKGRGLVSRLSSVLAMGWGFLQAWVWMLRSRPLCVVSVGGYVSMPITAAAAAWGIPVFLLEPNIRTGASNRIASRWAKKAFSVRGSDAPQKLKCAVEDSGTPVRKDLRVTPIREKVSHIVFLGGSQGARVLCRAAVSLGERLRGSGIRITLQSGAGQKAESEAWVAEKNLQDIVSVQPFVNDVPSLLESADLIVARAGAMTVAELAVTGTPVIFVPFPAAADDHQRVNAKLLADDGAAVYVEEKDAAFEEKLWQQTKSLALESGHMDKRQALSKKLKAWGRPQAATTIAQRITELLA